MKPLKTMVGVFALTTLMIFTACDKKGQVIDQVLGFTPDYDVKLGQQVAAEIESDTVEYPILPPADFVDAYNYLNAMKDAILASDNIEYRDIFAYELKIIQRDDVLNAFATPGGYIYVYTGLIKYLDSADDLAGVLGHEIAHAERRHSIEQMKKSLSIQFLISVALGEGTAADLATVAGNLLALKFSREDESESDAYSVTYLGDTQYACNGAASFFEKLEAQNQGGSIPAFLSTHPSPDTRVADINAKAVADACDTLRVVETGFTYLDFKNSLP
ncbi:MAG: M48 family metalloprotease [Cyclobacteriaceae bacterium]|nr:M48 family metalloprotease [Cyclobacteriaceae bacterium]